MRRFRRRGFRRRSQIGHWIASSAWSATETSITQGTLLAVNIVEPDLQAGLNVLEVNRATVQRVVGDILIRNTTTGSAIVSMGICVVPVSSAPAVDATDFDPALQGNTSKRWMWLRHGRILASNADTNLDSTNEQWVPNGTFVDVRVKRVLRNEALVFLLKSTTITATPVLKLNCFLRAFCTRVG